MFQLSHLKNEGCLCISVFVSISQGLPGPEGSSGLPGGSGPKVYFLPWLVKNKILKKHYPNYK